MKRIVVAFLIVPLVPALLFGITMAVWGFTSSWGIDPPITHVQIVPIWSMLALPVAYAATLALGVPAFLLFWRVGWLSPSAFPPARRSLASRSVRVLHCYLTSRPSPRLLVSHSCSAFMVQLPEPHFRRSWARPGDDDA